MTAHIGDEVVTSNGEVYVLRGEPPKNYSGANMETLAILLDQINTNLGILVDSTRWVGKYASIEEDLGSNVELNEYTFNFPVRYLRIFAYQPIKMRINDIGNPIINIDPTEMPYVISGINNGSFIHSIHISTGNVSTNIKILAFG